MKNLIFPVYEFRPLPDLLNVLRYNKGKWIPDDGKYDLAFVGKNKEGFPEAVGFKHNYRKNLLWSWCLNGNWGAKVIQHPESNAWHYMLKKGTKDIDTDFKSRDSHPNTIAYEAAGDKCSSLYNCANGDGPELHINDPYISQGLVREVDTKKVLTFPKIFVCMYCGKHDWKKEEGMTERQLEIVDIDYKIKQLEKQKKILISKENKK